MVSLVQRDYKFILLNLIIMASETVSERLTVIQTRLRKQVDAQINNAQFLPNHIEEEDDSQQIT